MKDKLKGLVMGIGIGAMLTGTAAFAADSTSIDVYFKNITFLFDGAQKQPAPDQKAFIYDGTTYVPLRFVGEALNQEVDYNGDTETITVDHKVIVATYMNGDKEESISRKQLQKFVAIQTLVSETGDEIDENDAINDMIALRVLYAQGDASVKNAVNDESVLQAQLAKIKAKAAIGSGWDREKSRLKLTDSDILSFVGTQIVATQALKATADDALLQTQYDLLKADHSFDYVTVQKIAVSTKTRTKNAAVERANEAQEKLLDGASFAEIAAAYSDETTVKSDNVNVNDLPSGVREAAIELPIGEISGPVEGDAAIYLVKVDSRTTKKLDDVKAQLRDLVLPTLTEQFKQIELPSLIVDVNLDAE